MDIRAMPTPSVPVSRARAEPGRGGSFVVLRPASGRVLRLQLVCIAGLLVVSAAARVAVVAFDPGPLLSRALLFFYVDSERALPTFYAVAVIFACAGLAFLVSRFERDVAVRRRGWTLVALATAWVGTDELLIIHERAVEPVRQLLGITGGALYYAWVVPAFLLMCLLGVALLGFMRDLPRATRTGVLVAGGTFVLGAAGMEMVGAMLVTASQADLYSNESLALLPLVSVEEGLELLGMALFLTTLVRHVEREHPGAGLHLNFMHH